jgi:hypothetical protein
LYQHLSKKFRFRENGCVLLSTPRLNTQFLFIFGFLAGLSPKSGRYLASIILQIPSLNHIVPLENASASRQNDIVTEQNDIASRQNGIVTEQNGIASRQNGIVTEQNGIASRQNDIVTEQNGIVTLNKDITSLPFPFGERAGDRGSTSRIFNFQIRKLSIKKDLLHKNHNKSLELFIYDKVFY